MSVYGGGHSVNGAAVVDAGLCHRHARHEEHHRRHRGAKVAHADAGLTWGEFDAATQEHGLAVTGGRMSTTGIAGLALGSGSGWLERKFGYRRATTCSRRKSSRPTVVSCARPRPRTPTCSGALRGGGGNFGIVTKFELQLHDLGPIVYGGLIAFPAFMANDVIPVYREFMRNAPDEVGGGLAFLCAPPEEFVPKEAWGMPIVGIVACYAGPVEDGEAAYQPLRDLGPVVDMFGPMPYVAVQQLLDAGNPPGNQNYWTADFYDELSDEALETMIPVASQPISPLTAVILVPMGGALARVPDEEMAFGMRTAAFNIHYLSQWADPAENEANIKWTKDLSESMRKFSTGGCVPELHRRRGREPRRAGLRQGEVSAPPRAEARLGPHKLLPHQPEHPARRLIRARRQGTPCRRDSRASARCR